MRGHHIPPKASNVFTTVHNTLAKASFRFPPLRNLRGLHNLWTTFGQSGLNVLAVHLSK